MVFHLAYLLCVGFIPAGFMAIVPSSQKNEGKEKDLKYIKVSYMYSKGKGYLH